MYQDIITAITTVGFPIVACGAMGWFMVTFVREMNSRIDKLNEQHKEESDKMVEAINNNTVAITKLCEKMESGH